jgi:general secretion pathway protein H
VSPAGYGFERHDGQGWAAMARPPFQDRQWPVETQVTVAQQDRERTRVIFDATGLTDPLDLTLARDGQQIGVTIGADGTIRVEG